MSGSLPYQPIADAISTHVRTCSPEKLRAILGNSAVDLAKIAPEIGYKLPDLPQPEPQGTEAERRNLYSAVARYFNTLAAESPLILILDDLQWADAATLHLLNFLTLQGLERGRPQGSPLQEGKIKWTGDRWQSTVEVSELEIPHSVRLLIERRLVHLSPECRTTLAVAAVMGRQFSSTLLCQARNVSEDVVAEHIDNAIQLQIVASLSDPVGPFQDDRKVFQGDRKQAGREVFQGDRKLFQGDRKGRPYHTG